MLSLFHFPSHSTADIVPFTKLLFLFWFFDTFFIGILNEIFVTF